LFGYEAGAFRSRKTQTRLSSADGVCYFLIEISSMPVDIQAKLLRAIENALSEEWWNNLIQVDVQIVAASNRHLPTMIRHQFREDRYYRLKGG
jgi:DNA-binding NtrC family response regulator